MIVMYSLKKHTPECKEYLDQVGFYVQSIGGNFSVHRYHVSFHVPIKYTEFMLLKYSCLKMEAYVW